MFRTYKSELIDKKIILTDDNEIKERKNVANWLEAHSKWDIRKYDPSWKKANTVIEVFYLIKDSIESKLPNHQRASTWNEFITKVTDINCSRPITKLEDIAITYMKKNTSISPRIMPETPTQHSKYVEIIGNTDKILDCCNLFDVSNKLTQFIYFGSKDESNRNMGIVKTIFSEFRDQEFEQEWYKRNNNAKLFFIKNELKIPFSDIAVWEKREHVFPVKRNFISFVNAMEPNKPKDKIEKYIHIAVNQLDEYFELDEIDRKLTITHKFVDLMKQFMDTSDDKVAIEKLKKVAKSTSSVLGKRTLKDANNDNHDDVGHDVSKKRKSTVRKDIICNTPDTLDYSNDIQALENNRHKWNENKTKGYKILQQSNGGFAPYGYNEDFSERIAPYGFVDNDQSKRVRIKGSMWNK